MSGTPEVTGGGETRSFSVWDRAVSIEDKLLTLEFEEPLRSNTSYEVVVPPRLVWDGQNELLEAHRSMSSRRCATRQAQQQKYREHGFPAPADASNLPAHHRVMPCIDADAYFERLVSGPTW